MPSRRGTVNAVDNVWSCELPSSPSSPPTSSALYRYMPPLSCCARIDIFLRVVTFGPENTVLRAASGLKVRAGHRVDKWEATEGPPGWGLRARFRAGHCDRSVTARASRLRGILPTLPVARALNDAHDADVEARACEPQRSAVSSRGARTVDSARPACSCKCSLLTRVLRVR